MLLGLELSVLYDFLRGLRRLSRGIWCTFLCDIVFWGCTAVLSFRLMHGYSNGLFHWYAVGAAFFAMWLYGKTVGRLIHQLSQALAGPAKNALTKLKRLVIIKADRKRKEADPE